MPPPAPPSRPGRSPVQLILGAVLVAAAMALAVYAFVSLIGVLESGGYGTPAMRRALIGLGVAGVALAGGIATLIWEIAKRYENPGSERAPDSDPAT